MGRYIAQHNFNPAYSVHLFYEIKSYLEYEGFEYVNYENEYVFQKGEGWLVAPTFVKITLNGNTLHLETWLKCALLPGVFVGEFGLKGFYGWAVKGTMKRIIATVPTIVQKYSGSQALPTTPQTAQPVPPVAPLQPPMQQPTPMQYSQNPQYPQTPQYPQYPQYPKNR